MLVYTSKPQKFDFTLQHIKTTRHSIRYVPCLGRVNASAFCRKVVQGVQLTKSANEPRMSHESKMVNDCFLHTHTKPTKGENTDLRMFRQLRSGENPVFSPLQKNLKLATLIEAQSTVKTIQTDG